MRRTPRQNHGRERAGNEPSRPRAPRDDVPAGALAPRERWIAAAIVIVAIAIRWLAVARGHQLDIDEADTALKVAKPVAALIGELTRDGHPPLYFLVLKAWTSLAGDSEVALRSLSILFSIGTLVLVLHVARRLYGPLAALFAGLLFAVSPVEIFHAAEGRMYTLLPLEAVATMALVARMVDPSRAPRRWHGVALVLVLVAALYTHNYGLFIPAAAWLVFVAAAVADPARPGALSTSALAGTAQLGHTLARKARALLPRLAIIGAAYLCYLPWLPILQAQRASKAHVWLIEFFDATPPIMAIPLSLAALGGTGPYPPITPPLRGAHAFLPFTLALAVIIFAAGSRSARASARAAAPLLFIAALLGAPWLVSVTTKVVYLVGRYDVVALPFVILVLGAGAAALARVHRALLVIPILFLAAPLPATRALLSLPRGGDVVDQVSVIAANADTRAVIATQLSGSRLRYYLARRGRSDVLVRSFPTSTDEHPGWFERPDPADPSIAADAESLLAAIEIDLDPGEYLWATLYDNDEAKSVLVHAMARRFAAVPEASRLDLGLLAVTDE